MTCLVLDTSGPTLDPEKGRYYKRYSVRIDSEWRIVTVECDRWGGLPDRQAAASALYAMADSFRSLATV